MKNKRLRVLKNKEIMERPDCDTFEWFQREIVRKVSEAMRIPASLIMPNLQEVARVLQRAKRDLRVDLRQDTVGKRKEFQALKKSLCNRMGAGLKVSQKRTS